MTEPNTLLSIGDVEKDVVLVGGEDPELVESILKQLGNIRLIKKSRGFHCYNFKAENNLLTIMITGIGPSCTEIAFNELAKCGAKTFIRAGTSGALKKSLDLGSVIITKTAIRLDGVSDLYVDSEFEAKADESIILALKHSSDELNMKYKVGNTISSSSFYALGGEVNENELKFNGYALNAGFKPLGLNFLETIQKKKDILNVEMESATLLTLSRLQGLAAGSVCGISNYIPWYAGSQISNTEQALRNAIQIAIHAIKIMHEETF